MYIAGTFCLETIPGIRRNISKDCGSCDFYRMLKEEHGSEISAYSFLEYVKRNKISHEITVNEILWFGKHLKDAAEDGIFQKIDLHDIWLRLLGLVDYCNHAVKRGEWYQKDVEQFYNLKDSVMKKLYRNPPDGVNVNLKRVLDAESSDNNEYEPESLSRLKLNEYPDIPQERQQYDENTDLCESTLIEMQVTHEGRMFCFHIPAEKVKDWGLNVTVLSFKKWIPSREFNRQFFKESFEKIQELLNLISRVETVKEKTGIG